MTVKEKERLVLNLYADNQDLFAKHEHLLFKDVWSTDFNSKKYILIKWNYENKKKPDTYLLSNQLKKAGFNQKEILLEIGDPNYNFAKNIDEWVNDIFEDYCKRKLAPLMHRVHSEVTSDIADVNSCIEELKNAVNEIELIKNNLSIEKKITDIFDSAFNELMLAQANKSEVIGYSTGLNDLDAMCGGLKQEVIVVGAPPGSGKSSLMVTLIENIAIRKGLPMLIHSLEMPATQLMKNMWANSLSINSYCIRGGSLLDEDIEKIKDYKNSLKGNLFIDDTPSVTWQYVETKVRNIRKNIPIDQLLVVIIDYLQIMRNTADETRGISSEEQYALRCNGLLEISKKYNCCMIELSQLSRDVGKRENKKPAMGDLKGSGAIEANAVQVWLLYRPDYFETDPIEDGMSLKGLCEINVAKNRYGETGRRYVKFEGKYSAFKNFNFNKDAF